MGLIEDFGPAILFPGDEDRENNRTVKIVALLIAAIAVIAGLLLMTGRIKI